MGRDANMSAVEQLGDEFAADAMVASIAKFKFKLRPDYKARHLSREQSMIVCLRRVPETVGALAPEPEQAEASITDIPETDAAEDTEESSRAHADAAAVPDVDRRQVQESSNE